MTNHILFPTKSNIGLITKFDVESVWLIKNIIRTNYANELIQYMVGSKIKGTCLPYGNLITKILEHTDFNFRNKKFLEDVTNIEEVYLEITRYGIIDGNVIEKPSKEK